MVTYTYVVRCPKCEDEFFDFFDEAKEFALGCISKKPVITQTEVNRNDFGECTDHCDLGTVWSWEDMMQDIKSDDTVFSKNETFGISEGINDFDDFDIGRRANEPKTWICWYEGRDIGTVIAATEDEAAEKMMSEYPQYDYNNTDWGVEKESDYIDFFGEDLFSDDDLGELALTESEQRLATNKNGDYLVSADSGKGYTVFNKSNVRIGGFDGDDDEQAIDKFNTGKINESKKPLPADMTIESLIEAMEENEDMVECKECYELAAKQDCAYEEGRGYVCSNCSSHTNMLSEAFNPNEPAEFYYDELTAVVTGNQRDADDWDEAEFTSDYTYAVEKGDVAVVIFENFMTDEDIKDVPGGFEALEDNAAWMKFLESHFDTLFDKYYEQLLVYYKEDATEAFNNSVSWDDYQDYEADRRAEWRSGFDESCATKSMLEELEEPEEYRQRLTTCPECGDNTFDIETGVCINCGFTTLTEDTETDDKADRPDYLNVNMPEYMIVRMQKEVEDFIKEAIEKCKKAKTNSWYHAIQFKLPSVFGIPKDSNKGKTTQYIIDELAKAGFPGGEQADHDSRILLVPLKNDTDLDKLAKDMKDKEDELLRNYNPNDPISAGRRAAAGFEKSPYDASSFRKPLDDGRIAAHKAQGDR